MSDVSVKTIAFTGGGTGGHVYPALALIDHLKDSPNLRFLWIGSKGGMEEKIVKKAGIDYYRLPAGKLRRYFSIQNFLDLFKVLGGLVKAYFLLGKLKPDLVFSKGGFVSVPPVLAARLRRIPVLAHESDSEPGLATKINLKSVKTLFVPYQKTADSITPGKNQKIIVSGNPVRSIFFEGDGKAGRKYVGASGKKPLIVVLGGSSGALQINQLIGELRKNLTEKFFVVHQMGDKLYKESDTPDYFSAPYFQNEIADILTAADLCISRAGAGTLWELAATSTPAILIPLGTSASRGDQIKNAKIFRENGLAEVFTGTESADLLKMIKDIVQNADKLNKMKTAARDFPGKDAVEIICATILKEIGFESD